ncbi:acetyl-CoA hydrolase/transferase family protein [Alteriqipengyuania sp.]|uniref:acetyl-CoA hydrolase/transferase family protein n=1 Tax=Alteriqipengyuania sp. TaxID=2800692 RepID=UPI0035135911
MSRKASLGQVDWSALLEPGETVLFAECGAEPLSLAESFVAQRHALTDISVFLGMGFAGSFTPEHGDALRFRSYGALGTTRKLAAADKLDIVPVSMGSIPALLRAGALRFDVVAIALPPAARDGRHSLGLTALYLQSAIRHARLVIAEISDKIPSLPGISIGPEEIDLAVRTDRTPAKLPPIKTDGTAHAIARNAAPFIEDGAVLQIGVGSAPEAIAALLTDRKDIGIHSGLLSAGLASLIEQGVATGARKNVRRGIATIGSVMGDAALYRWAKDNPCLELAGVEETHLGAAHVENFVAVNGALSVDLQGQVNGESAGDRRLGAIGGQPDFARAAHHSPGGCSIILLDASPGDGSISAITARTLPRVSTPRSDVDVVATQFGAAHLTGRTEEERRKLLISIADPRHREALERGLI